MRNLLVLFSLLLSASAASAQTEKPVPVTKLPGEESLSVQERAERDFLMPVRRKQVAEAPAAATNPDNITAAPEQDAVAQHMELALAAREEAIAPVAVREVRAVRHTAHRSTRARHADSSKATHSSKSGKSSKSKSKTSKSSKTKSSRSTSANKKSSHSTSRKSASNKKTSKSTSGKVRKTAHKSRRR